MQKFTRTKTLQVLSIIVLSGAILYAAKSFLIPLAFAIVISMLLLPVAEWLNKKLVYWLSVTIAMLLFLAIIAGIITVLSWQISGLVEESGNIEQLTHEKITQFQQYIQQHFGISVQKQNNIASGKTGGNAGGYITNAVSDLLAGIGIFLADFILFIVYAFLLLLYKSHLKLFLLKIFFSKSNSNATSIMSKCRKVAQQYVANLSLMIVILCVMYSIGFSIVGVKNAVLFAMIASVLETIPFIGNITGTLLTILMTIAQGGSAGMVIGVFCTYVTVQFIQTYFLETLIVGEGVNVNPLVTIAGLAAGELIWGIPGMVLAIPLLGISKIIFDNIPSLQPIGFLMGKVRSKSKA